MAKPKSSLIECLQVHIEKAGLNWLELSKTATEIIIFGSRAVALNKQTSDLDVLVINGSANRIKRCGLDLICISAQDSLSSRWLGSELASHVAKYGQWAKGEGDWCSQTLLGKEAVYQKERRLVSLVRSLRCSWNMLHPTFQVKYRTTIRRELQRLQLLQRLIPIPPTPALDSEWHTRKTEQSELLDIVNSGLFQTGIRDFIARTLIRVNG